MGRLFNIAIEEAMKNNPVVAERVSPREMVRQAETLAESDAEISQDIQAMEELMEEQQVLQQQVDTNGALLENPDAVVTVADVEVSEETRMEVAYHLGYKNAIDKIRLSNESTYRAVKEQPRKYLTISTEGLGDMIKNIWEKIKAFFKKIWNKIRAFFGKRDAKKEKDTIDNLATKIKIVGNPAVVSKDFIDKAYGSYPYFAIAMLNAPGNIISNTVNPVKYEGAIAKLMLLVTDTYKEIESACSAGRITNFLRNFADKGLFGEDKIMHLYKKHLEDFAKIQLFGNDKLLKAIKEQTNAEKDILTILSVSKSSIKYIPKGWESSESIGALTAEFNSEFKMPSGAIKDGDKVTLSIGANDMSNILNMLNKTSEQVAPIVEKMLNAYQGMISKSEQLFNAIDKGMSMGNNRADRVLNAAKGIVTNVASPTLVANYAQDINSFRKTILEFINESIEIEGDKPDLNRQANQLNDTMEKTADALGKGLGDVRNS